MLKKRDEPGDESLFSWSTVPRRVFVHGFPSWFLSATGVAVPFRVDGDPNGENMRFCGTSEDSTQSPHLQRPSEGLRYVGMVRGRLTQSHLKSTKSSLKPTLVPHRIQKSSSPARQTMLRTVRASKRRIASTKMGRLLPHSVWGVQISRSCDTVNYL